VPGGVHQLEIEQHQIGRERHGQKHAGGRAAAGIEHGRYAPLAAGAEQRGNESRLGQRFASGKRHAASGLFEEDEVSLDFRDQLGDSQPPARDLARFRVADLGALAAAPAKGGGAYGAVHPLDGVLRTGGNAIAAMTASLLEIQQFGLQLLTFGIVAPPAGEWTAFEKDGGTDSGPSCVENRMILKSPRWAGRRFRPGATLNPCQPQFSIGRSETPESAAL